MFDLLVSEDEGRLPISLTGRRMNDFMPTILIADDDEDSRTMLRILLEMWNYRVVEAKDGAEAISLAEKTRPDLILMDVRMPGLDGFETAQAIRESAMTGGDAPIIFLSGCGEAIYRDRMKDAGGNEYLVKPLDFDLLEKTLDKCLSELRENSAEDLRPSQNLYKPKNRRKLRKNITSLL